MLLSWVRPGQGQFSPGARSGHSQATDPTWPNKRDIRYHGVSHSVLSGDADCGEVSHSWGARWASGGESCSVCSLVLISIVGFAAVEQGL